eukprot:TRINITY_DN1507_c0_g1_i7.p1 TRINITY_DN1507_c0_g1~~TRINITY_DN1507_c0_g1_i7.p1  ORF type:complete len:183 (-),score=38.43 TRINITY_DN1507_c0_g1_i7:41-589(-)
MNAHLVNTLIQIREKAEDIHKGISTLQNTLPPWPELISQSTVLLHQYQTLLDQLSPEPILNHLILQPKATAPADSQIVPNLLRTKTLPEIEMEEEELWKHYNKENPLKYSFLLDERVEYNEIIDHIDSEYEKAKTVKVDSKLQGPQQVVPTNYDSSDLFDAMANGVGEDLNTILCLCLLQTY